MCNLNMQALMWAGLWVLYSHSSMHFQNSVPSVKLNKSCRIWDSFSLLLPPSFYASFSPLLYFLENVFKIFSDNQTSLFTLLSFLILSCSTNLVKFTFNVWTEKFLWSTNISLSFLLLSSFKQRPINYSSSLHCGVIIHYGVAIISF